MCLWPESPHGHGDPSVPCVVDVGAADHRQVGAGEHAAQGQHGDGEGRVGRTYVSGSRYPDTYASSEQRVTFAAWRTLVFRAAEGKVRAEQAGGLLGGRPTQALHDPSQYLR